MKLVFKYEDQNATSILVVKSTKLAGIHALAKPTEEGKKPTEISTDNSR
jgi:hypothetical protein